MEKILSLVFLVLFLVACAQPAVQTETIKIGAILPLSGPNAVYGEEIQNAIELAKDEIQEINGKKIEIIYEDDKSDPKIGVTAMQKLVDIDDVKVVLGSWVSGVVVASAPIAESNKMIVMAEAISPAITNAGDYIFRIQPSATFYSSESAKFLNSINITKAAVLYLNNEFGVALKDAFINDFTAFNGKLLAEEAYDETSQDFKTQLSKIEASNPEVVFIAGYQDTVNVIKQMNKLDINSMIIAGPHLKAKRSWIR